MAQMKEQSDPDKTAAKNGSGISAFERLGILSSEHSSLIQKMNSNESWAYSFVALYFAFVTSIGTVVGFLLIKLLAAQMSDALALSTGQAQLNWWLRLIVVTLSSLGLLLNIWAVYMVFDYKRATERLSERASEIEERMSDIMGEKYGFISAVWRQNSGPVWKIGTVLVVGPVMFMFFVPWLLILRAVN